MIKFFSIVVLLVVLSNLLKAQVKIDDSLYIANEFKKNNIKAISLKSLEEITSHNNDSAYVVYFGTPSWCEPCTRAVRTLQKIVNENRFGKSRFIIVAYPEYKKSIKSAIEFFKNEKITIEKYFCFTQNEIFKGQDFGVFPIMFVVKGNKIALTIDSFNEEEQLIKKLLISTN